MAATARPPAPAIAIGYAKKSACVRRLTSGLRTICQSNHQFVAIVVTATAAVWSIATFARSKVAGPVQATETSAPVSPHEIMIKQGRNLPVEYWAHPF
jgi:hypothetical protein